MHIVIVDFAGVPKVISGEDGQPIVFSSEEEAAKAMKGHILSSHSHWISNYATGGVVHGSWKE